MNRYNKKLTTNLCMSYFCLCYGNFPQIPGIEFIHMPTLTKTTQVAPITSELIMLTGTKILLQYCY